MPVIDSSCLPSCGVQAVANSFSWNPTQRWTAPNHDDNHLHNAIYGTSLKAVSEDVTAVPPHPRWKEGVLMPTIWPYVAAGCWQKTSGTEKCRLRMNMPFQQFRCTSHKRHTIWTPHKYRRSSFLFPFPRITIISLKVFDENRSLNRAFLSPTHSKMKIPESSISFGFCVVSPIPPIHILLREVSSSFTVHPATTWSHDCLGKIVSCKS